MRIVEICTSSIFKQILSLIFWLYICNVQAFKNIKNDQEMVKKFEILLHEKYFIVLATLHQPKDIILEYLPILLSKAITLILADNLH
jgi:hypothetical protein